MVLLDACTSFCDGLRATLGPTLSELVLFGAGIALAWWRAHKAIGKVEAKATAGVKIASERASLAETAANTLRVELAELRGSLRPASAPPGFSLAPTLPPIVKPAAERADEPAPLEGLTSASGTYQPVRFPELPEGVAKPPATNLVDPQIPRPSAVPKIDEG
jgi:hypothetical protein